MLLPFSVSLYTGTRLPSSEVSSYIFDNSAIENLCFAFIVLFPFMRSPVRDGFEPTTIADHFTTFNIRFKNSKFYAVIFFYDIASLARCSLILRALFWPTNCPDLILLMIRNWPLTIASLELSLYGDLKFESRIEKK